MKLNYILKCGLFLIFSIFLNSDATAASDPLETAFLNPLPSASPYVYWWWLEGNVTREGITRDLEEMKDRGIGGALIFDAGSSSYNVAARTPAGPVFLSPQWRELYRHALREAARLGIEIGLNIQSGWNPGGPMVEPEWAMKKIVWSEKQLRGPQALSEVLPVSEKVRNGYYRDIAVLAYLLPDGGPKEHQPIQNWDIKSVNGQFRGWKGAYPLHILREQNPSVPGEEDVKHTDIIDLTAKMDAEGRLKWDVPKGSWMILRFGYTLTGARVSTCSPGWEGLSLDHLTTGALDRYWAAVVEPLLAEAGELVGSTLAYLHTDSWEMGPVNWTADFPAEFKKRRGYDLTPYLPVMAGKIVDSREVSNRFLWDLRRTIGDCIAENHYRKFAEYAHKRGMGVHPESGGPHSAPIDALQCLGTNDIPMGEFWARATTHRVLDTERLFSKQPASAAHIYGKKYVNAEGFTTIGPQWERDAWDLKPVADREFCEGVNRIYFHQFTASQLDAGIPGNEYFAGTHYNPNITWWEQSVAFNDYLSRCQYLLQQGLFVADVCYYYGDDVPNFVPLKHIPPELGAGYDYDEVNSDVILNRMAVKDGRITLPDGMSYRLLVLPEWKSIRLDVLRKIAQLVSEGATVVGPKPERALGLSDYPRSDQMVKELADELWGPCDGFSVKQHFYKKGRIFWGKSLRDILMEDGVLPDFTFQSRQDGTMWEFLHRTYQDADIYFVINRNNCYSEALCQFRVTDKIPELWDPATGQIQRQLIFQPLDGVISIPMRLDPYGSRFVVFRSAKEPLNWTSIRRNGLDLFAPLGEPVDPFPVAELVSTKDGMVELLAFKPGRYELESSSGQLTPIEVDRLAKPIELSGPWNLTFPKNWGAPASVVFDELISWTESNDPGVKYFSGTGTYKKLFRLTEEQLKNSVLFLDLGAVKNLAEVRLNGKNLGILWKKPFRVNITPAVKTGENTLEIEVTNLWPNRLIGDQFLPPDKRYTQTNIKKFNKESPLMDSGLLGTVKIHIAKIMKVRL
jgi:hypothetical protein